MFMRAVAIAAVATVACPIFAQSTYTQVGQYELPSLGGSVSTSIDGSGRLWRLVGSSVYRQDAVNSSSFSLLGSVDAGGEGFSVSPDGQRFAFISGEQTVRSGLTSQLSTSSTATTTATNPGGRLSAGGLVWSGQSFYVSSFSPSTPGPGGGSPASANVHRITGDASPVVTTVATVPGLQDTGSPGGLAAWAGRVYWEYDQGFDSARVATLNLSALDAAVAPIVNPTVLFNTVTRGRALVVDGNQTVAVLPRSFVFNVGRFFNGFTGATNPGVGDIGNIATFVVYNPLTAELIVGTNRATEVALRYTIPTPSAAAVLGLAGLAAAGRRRR